MGRSSRNELPTEPVKPQAQTANSLYPTATSGAQTASSRATSESESMARDIKEGRLSGFVGYGTTLTGETNFQAMLRVDGHLTGRVLSETGTLIVGSTGRVDANVVVSAAVINGIVNGDIIATERLELGRTAHVVGNVQAPRLVMEDGALLEGNCTMIKARENLERMRAEANAPVTVANAESTNYQTDETAEAMGYGGQNEEDFEASAR
jgi:cytoskeletal protein CcmA (bactofilin family)